jgi:hypothetical protein
MIDVAAQTILGKYIPMPAGFPFPMPDPTPQEGQVAVVIPDTLSWQCVNKVSLVGDEWVFEEDQDTKQMYLNGLRTERNNRLAASDWTQLADAPVDREAWAGYRQALRDLPGATINPAAPVWPEKPN